MGILDENSPPRADTDLEGVTKFSLRYKKSAPLPAARLTELKTWRRTLFDLGLIGEERTAQGAIGFGNISARLTQPHGRADAFVITATQTGHKPRLSPKDYSIVTQWDLDAFWIEAEGPARPSSESLTHAILYATLPTVRFVFHIHSPDIWSQALTLGLPTTDPRTPYGTPQIAHEVRMLLATFENPQAGLLAMGGHKDGIISFGTTSELAGQTLLQTLARARAYL